MPRVCTSSRWSMSRGRRWKRRSGASRSTRPRSSTSAPPSPKRSTKPKGNSAPRHQTGQCHDHAAGQVKILDFGLAAVTSPEFRVSRSNPSELATRNSELETVPGTILGTVECMSPEQVLGREVDRRSTKIDPRCAKAWTAKPATEYGQNGRSMLRYGLKAAFHGPDSAMEQLSLGFSMVGSYSLALEAHKMSFSKNPFYLYAPVNVSLDLSGLRCTEAIPFAQGQTVELCRSR